MSEQSRVPKPSSGAEQWTSEHISVDNRHAGVHVHFAAPGCVSLLVAAPGRSWLMLAALTAHIHDACLHPTCIAVGVAARVVVVALVVAQPAADARSRRTRRISCAHDASKLLKFALGCASLLLAAPG